MAPLVWLITGVSFGLGLALAHAVLARGDHVIATARNISSPALQELQTHGATLLALDVTHPTATITSLISDLLTSSPHTHIDILVNNAGYLEIGVLEDLPDEQWHAQFETNVFGAVKLAIAVLPPMRARGSGTVIWVGIVAGWKGDATSGVYCGSKFALGGIAESFREEVARLGIKSLLVEPGYFRTSFISSQNFKTTFPSASTAAAYSSITEGLHAAMTAYSGHQPGSPTKAASRIIDVVTSSGIASGRPILSRLVLGRDALKVVREKCESTLALLREREDIGRSTDF